MEVGPVRSAQEWAQVREICCDTGAAGKPIEPPGRRPFFGEFWIGPYQSLLPGWTFVARAGGEVLGYLTGCPDSPPFYARRLAFHRVPLLASVLAGRWGSTEDTRKFLHPLEGMRRNFALRFGLKFYSGLMRGYPAHLHINVRAGRREGGVGRAITDAYVARLEARGAPGVHLFCGANPVPFYRRVGFEELACLDLGRGPVYVMGRRLATAEKR